MREVAAPTTMSIFFFSFDSSCTASATDEVVSSVIMSTPSASYQRRAIAVARSGWFWWSAVTISIFWPSTSPEILDRHPGGLQRIFAASVGIDARLIVQDTDLDLCRSGHHEKHCANSHGRQQS